VSRESFLYSFLLSSAVSKLAAEACTASAKVNIRGAHNVRQADTCTNCRVRAQVCAISCSRMLTGCRAVCARISAQVRVLAAVVCVLFVLLVGVAYSILSLPDHSSGHQVISHVPTAHGAQQLLQAQERMAQNGSGPARAHEVQPVGQQQTPTLLSRKLPTPNSSAVPAAHQTPAAAQSPRSLLVSQEALQRVRTESSGSLAWDALQLHGCEEEVPRDSSLPIHQRAQALLTDAPRLWPNRGPTSGGGEVFIRPQTSAARQCQGGSVWCTECQFGVARAKAGYDAMYDVLVCSVPPQRYTIKPGDTLDALAAAHGIPLPQLLGLNVRLPRDASSVNIGDVIVLNAQEVSVTLTDSAGNRLTGEPTYTYQYHEVGVTSVEPQTLSTLGGQVVTVRGYGFDHEPLVGPQASLSSRNLDHQGKALYDPHACWLRCRFAARPNPQPSTFHPPP
jgi:LysM repeat protein